MDLLVRLRPGVPADRKFLWRLHCETMRDYVDGTWGWDEAWQRKRFEETFDLEALQIVEQDGEAIGMISIRRSMDEIFLASIEIAPQWQKRGVATHLIRQLLAESDACGLPVTLQVLKVNPARRLYERLGFVCSGETETHYRMRREPS